MSLALTTPEAETVLNSISCPRTRQIAQRALEGCRLTEEEGLFLLAEADEASVVAIADLVRHQRVGDTVYFATTLYVHPTNLCELSCPMCSFYSKPGWETAWFNTPEQVIQRVAQYHDSVGLSEVHVVGGLWRECDLAYYEAMFTGIKAIDSQIHIKALTPVEYDFLAKLHNIPIEEVFKRMMSWGLGSLPGGGAEVLVEKVRKQLAPQKISSEEFLAIHKIAHTLGLPSNITILFGSVEEDADIITHLSRVRSLQDETGGFRAFVPLKYHEENNALGKRKGRLKPKNIRKVYAVSRLMLDNVPNLKALWNYLGVETALDILRCGANDLAATQIEEKIIVMAGGVKETMTREKMSELIESVGRVPREAHSAGN